MEKGRVSCERVKVAAGKLHSLKSHFGQYEQKKSFFDNKIPVPLHHPVGVHALCVSTLALIRLNQLTWHPPMVSRKEKVPPEEYSFCPRTDAEDTSQE